MSDPIETAAEILDQARRLVVATGAGMSQESGIPTFRDAPGALWRGFDPERMATRQGFADDPDEVWAWYGDRRRMIARAEPHEGHRSLARLEALYDDFVLVTQNIDDLHTKAGSSRILELHGNIFRFKCFDNDHPADSGAGQSARPPLCHCGSLIRPAVVWFGESLDASDLDRATEAIDACDAVLVIGTSGLVYPAAGLPAAARENGSRVVEINTVPTPITVVANVFIEMAARSALPSLEAAVARRRAD